MKKRFFAVITAISLLLAVIAPLAAFSDGRNLRDEITRLTGISPLEAEGSALTGCFGGTVPGGTALAFDLNRSRVLLGERTGADSFSTLCWQLGSWREVQALALSVLPAYEEYDVSGSLAVCILDETGRLVIRSAGEAAAAALLSDTPLTHDLDALEADGTALRVEYRILIGNKRSHVFHLPACTSVADMKEHNKIPFASREEALLAGYRPCRRCNP